MNKELGLTILLVVLVLVSAVQAVQLIALGSQIESGEITGAVTSGTSQSSSTSGGASLPGSLTELPGMVGGC